MGACVDVKQVANVLELIEFFAERGRTATLAEISRHFDWPRSSTFNLLGTLVSRGYLYEPRAREGYYPSPRWQQLIGRIEHAAPVPARLHTLLQTLWERTGETVVLAAISGSQALFIDTIESPHSVRYSAPIGKLVPLHLTATGRALLSLLPEPDRAAVLRKAVFERHTPSTLLSVASVEEEIARSQHRGWFESAAEFSPDLGGVAMPLPLEQRQLAVLVGGPMFRVQPIYAQIAALMQQEVAGQVELAAVQPAVG